MYWDLPPAAARAVGRLRRKCNVALDTVSADGLSTFVGDACMDSPGVCVRGSWSAETERKRGTRCPGERARNLRIRLAATQLRWRGVRSASDYESSSL